MATTPFLVLRYPVDATTVASKDFDDSVADLANDIDAFAGVWASWTPTIAQGATGNIAKTNNNSRSRLIGKWCEFELRVAITGTGTASAAMSFSLPHTSKWSGPLPCGSGMFFDGSTSNRYSGPLLTPSGSSTIAMIAMGVGYLGAVTFTGALATTDVITADGFFEVL